MAPREDDQEPYDDSYADETYDASAEDDAYTEDVSDDGEWTDEEDNDGSSDNQPPQKKKRSPLTVIIIVVVTVVAVFGFLLMKGGKAPSGEQMAQVDTTQAQPLPTDQAGQPAPQQGQGGELTNLKDQPIAEIPANQQTPAVSAVAPQQGLMDNPELVNQSDLPAATELAAPTTTNSAQAQPEANSGLAGAVAAATPNVQAVSDFPTVDSIKKPGAEAPAEAPAPTPAPSLEQVTAQANPTLTAPTEAMPSLDTKSAAPVATTAAPAQDEATKAELDKANARIAELEKTLTEKNADLQKQKDALKASSNSEVDALKSKIAELESKLSSAEQAPAPEVKEVREVKPVRVVKPAPAATAPKAKTAVSSAKTVSWVLKSARPGRAVIANAKTGDYKSVSVGDEVAGIGKVTAIGESPAGWVVQGTSGKISE